MLKHCKICGKEFETKKNRTICYDKHTRICEICGKEFELHWPYTQKTCSSNMCRAQHIRNVSNSKKKVCELCGKEFAPKSPRQKYCEGPHIRRCIVCGTEFEYSKESKNKKTCGSKECIQKLRENTTSLRFGVSNAMKSEIVKERVKETNQLRYGVDWPSQNPTIHEKMENSLESRFGKRFSSQIPECRCKFESTMESRYGGKYTMNSEELRSKVIETMMKRYNVPFYCMTEDYHKFQRNLISKINKKFGSLLEMHNIEYEFEYRIQNRSYDICIPSSKLLIDIHPTITHNSYMSIYDASSNGLDKMYHFNKTKLASDHGWRCINVFDWDDWDKIINLIKQPKFIYYARTLKLSEVSKKQCDEFENTYHLQGTCYGQSVRLGLYNNAGDLIQIMTFGKPRYTHKYDWELLRLCTKSEIRVVGGASKLFAYFKKHYEGSIISYCDRSKFNGSVYEKLGMMHDHSTDPAKVWSKDTFKITDNLLRTRGYDQLFGTNYGKGTSNEELMIEHGWLPVYDCGMSVYEYRPNMKI